MSELTRDKPDIVEALTDQQMTEAVCEWLVAHRQLPIGDFTVLIQTRSDGVHFFRAWRKP